MKSLLYGLPVRNLSHAFKAPVSGLKVQVCRPVVRKVIGRAACRASRGLCNIGGRHGSVKGVAADDLVHVRRRQAAGLDERVQPLNSDLGAAETEVVEPVEELGSASSDRRRRYHQRKEHSG